MALGVDFAAHVLTVRYLLKEEFGAYSYALTIALFLSTAVQLGLPETLARFVPLYRERGQGGRVSGAVILSVAAVAGVGAACVAFVLGLPGLTASLLDSERATAVLTVLIFYVPLEGVNLVLEALFASFGRVRLIFLRQYVLLPGLRLVVVVALVTQGYGALFLAMGYVLASAAGLLLYGAGLTALASERTPGTKLDLPAREVFGFALPVFVGVLLTITLLGSATVALGVLRGPAEVAEFEAVLPPARLNQLVYAVFSVLYLPTAAGLLARGLTSDLRHTYSTTTLWMVVLGFPGLALTTSFAPAFVPTVFGERYASSTDVLVLLALAYFLLPALGPNSLTLKVLGRLRYAVTVDFITLVIGLVLIVSLVLLAGAAGAALGTLLALVARNTMLQRALRRSIGGAVLGRDYVRLMLGVLTVLVVLAAIQVVFDPPLVVAVALSAGAGGGIMLAARHMLDIESIFPELRHSRLAAFLRR